jgi:curved DNA-binding protein
LQNHYTTLGVHKSSTLAEIQTAFRALARENHPDRHNNDPVKASRMAACNVAYNTLSDPKLRKKHDIDLANFGNKCPACEGTGAVTKQKGFQKKVRTACTTCGGAGVLA